ncbi:DUF3772 domain-containing protein [Alsobacter sp. SYSU M60028]|uniref:DUF3772 domain-containing protein n=1 Tax=Alsobacter ponti TaxID=2962936 RepID=A0ABT1LJV7_9HYPH|nr:DUF3772 domain-containing protein [Alsobacter ponti]MCP8940533.1 DUF3772 domain-containing protein [Alsobacter ponti]
MTRARHFLLAAAFAALAFAAGPGGALGQNASAPAAGQPAPAQPTAATPPALPPAQTQTQPPATPVSPAVAAQKVKLDAARIQVGQIEAGLERRDLSDQALQRLRQGLEPLADVTRAAIDDLSPRADAVRLRLKELGPKPDDKAAPEGQEVTREREERQAALNEIDETVRIGRALLVQIEQVSQEIADRRRDLFARRLFEPSFSVLSPQLWYQIGRDIPSDLRAMRVVAGDIVDRAVQRLTVGGAFAVLAGLLLTLVLMLPVRRYARAFLLRERQIGDPTRLQKATAAALITFVSAVAPTAAAWLLVQIIGGLDILPPRLNVSFQTLVGAVAFIAFVRGLAGGILAPDPSRANWRLFPVSDEAARSLLRLATTAAALTLASRLLANFYQAIAAGIRLTVATEAVLAILTVLTVARALPLIRRVSPEDEAALGPHVSDHPDFTGLIRVVGWAVASAVIASAVLGFVALAGFLADQAVWCLLLVSLLTLLLILSDEWITAIFAHRSRFSRSIQASIGLSAESLVQIGILVSGLVRVVLIGVAVLLLLAPWGVESGDVLASIRTAFFGVTIAGVTLSLSNIILGLVVFVLGMAATRAVQRWLQKRYLPHTTLDAGLRNSITTGAGYLGVILAFAFSASYIGLSLDKLTIVAGALSVGIGFGLQSIVNNFVSGLILLAERAIRVGDWVVVGSEQGYVKRINVRATQIETFDRATLIVPNSTLVSGNVKNWVHSDRVGRVLLTVPVAKHLDPDKVAGALRDVASANPDVLEDPPPRVLFKGIGEGSMSFDLVCFVGEVDTAARVTSDLTFAVYRKLTEAGLGWAAPGPTKFEFNGLDELERLRREVADLRAALGRDAPQQTAPGDAAKETAP